MCNHRGKCASRQLPKGPDHESPNKGPEDQEEKIKLQGDGKGEYHQQFVGSMKGGGSYDGEDLSNGTKVALDVSSE